MMRAGFALDLERCTGCSACRVACRVEHQLGAGSWRRVYSFNRQRLAGLGVHHLSLACNHCADAPCMAGCPAAAFSRDPVSSAVILDGEGCMGCRYCSWVCPYGAPGFDVDHGVMGKCDFCAERTGAGLPPACVQACPVAALALVERVEGEAVVAGLPRPALGAALVVRPRRNGQRGPEISPAPGRSEGSAPGRVALTAARLAREWSLLLFSLTVMVLVAWQLAAQLGGPPLDLVSFAVGGALAMGVSLLHLGRPARAWRAALNLSRSWLSREVVAFSVFFAVTVTLLVLDLRSPYLHGLAAAAGLLAVGSMDLVYRVPSQRIPALPHSAMATLSVVLGLGVLAGVPVLVAAALGLKLVLYLLRCSRQVVVPPWLLIARLGLGFALPVVAWLSAGYWLHPLALFGLAAGEVVDRAQFYAELRFLDPALQIERDLQQWRAAAASSSL